VKTLKEHLISGHLVISEALEKLSALGNDLTLFVIDQDNKLKGTLTDGDIRRGLIKGFSINDTVSKYMNTDFKYIMQDDYGIQQIRDYKNKGIILLPLLNNEMKIIEIINLNIQGNILPVTACVMAGGEGERLRPMTQHTPKPLLKIGNKPILEHVIDKFVSYGITKVNISVNYLGEQVVDYFKNGESKNIDISYIHEKEKLGTAGSLALIEQFHHDVILLMNADLLTNINFEDFYLRFIESGADMMIACTPYTISVPYAILEIEDSQVKSLKEKPTYTYYSNAGIYLIKKEYINLVPKSRSYNATDLIEDLIAAEKKVAYYPILGFWLDIGNHDDFRKANEYIKHNSI
jgi:dTDP-glucose pyrophosphorylase